MCDSHLMEMCFRCSLSLFTDHKNPRNIWSNMLMICRWDWRRWHCVFSSQTRYQEVLSFLSAKAVLLGMSIDRWIKLPKWDAQWNICRSCRHMSLYAKKKHIESCRHGPMVTEIGLSLARAFWHNLPPLTTTLQSKNPWRWALGWLHRHMGGFLKRRVSPHIIHF